MGVEILRNLRGQRETIENTRDTVSFHFVVCPYCQLSSYPLQLRTADSNIDRADSTVKKMIRQCVPYVSLPFTFP
jgi:vesicle transport through interaction with t-SNAREs protein 1